MEFNQIFSRFSDVTNDDCRELKTKIWWTIRYENRLKTNQNWIIYSQNMRAGRRIRTNSRLKVTII